MVLINMIKNRQYENEDLVDKLLNIDLIIFLLILKLLNMIGVFILKVKKKKLNLKHNILWLKINLKMILLELFFI